MTAARSLRFFLLLTSLLIGSLAAAAQQFKLEMTTCEDLKVTEAVISSMRVETASCLNQTKAFKPKGELRNVHVLATFTSVATGAAVTFVVTKNDANGEAVRDVDYWATPRNTTAHAQLTINQAGKYFVRLVSTHNKSQVWATTEFTVGEDSGGPRATGNTAAGGGMVAICKTVDDDWNCVGGSSEWKANQGFDVLFKNPTPVGVSFIGIVFYKQGPDGRDVEFINEYQQNIGDANRMYATTNNVLKLPAGTYSVYIISWGKRETMVKNGNLKEYFAKMTLTVK